MAELVPPTWLMTLLVKRGYKSFSAFAKSVGRSRISILKLFQRRRHRGLETYEAIAEALGMTLDQLSWWIKHGEEL